MVDFSRLGRRITAARKEKGLSQEKLAELADITATNLSHIERGKIKTSIETLVSISNALGCTPNDLLCDSLPYATIEIKNVLARHIQGCSDQELLLLADIAECIQKRLRS